MQAECFQLLHNRCHCCRLQKGCSGDLHGIRAGRLHCSCHLLDFAGVCVNLTQSDRLVAARTSRVALSIDSARIAKRSEEHTSELQSLMRISYAVFCLKKKKKSTLNSSNSNQQNTTSRHQIHTTQESHPKS